MRNKFLNVFLLVDLFRKFMDIIAQLLYGNDFLVVSFEFVFDTTEFYVIIVVFFIDISDSCFNLIINRLLDF